MWTKYYFFGQAAHHAGYKNKIPYREIYIEALLEQAEEIFYSRFGCSSRSSYYESYCGDSIENLSELMRRYGVRTRWGTEVHTKPIGEYLSNPEILVIRNEDVGPKDCAEVFYNKIPSRKYNLED